MRLSILTVSVLVTLVACGASVAEPSTQPPPLASASDTASAASPTASAAPPQLPTLTDAQIAAITDAANTGEIEQAELALKRTKSAKVKAFAQMMIDHHGDAKRKQAALVATLKLTPEASPVSRDLTNDGSAALVELGATKTSGEFDSDYIALQVKEHEQALELFDQRLIPAATNTDLKAALTDFRPKVSDHLKQAKDIQASLSTKDVAKSHIQ